LAALATPVQNAVLERHWNTPSMSLRTRLTNRLLSISAKRVWRAGLDIDSIRARALTLDSIVNRAGARVPQQAVVINGVPCTWYGPAERSANGTLLYFHGGGWCMHLPFLYARFAGRLSDATGLRVLLPDYRLAPQHRFPAGVDDCFAVYRGIVVDEPVPRPLFVAGDSAGGSLSVVVMMRAREAGYPLPSAAVLLSPCTDLTMSGDSHRYNERLDPIFSLAATELLPDVYCPGIDRRHPWLSPLFAHWHGLPPLLILAGSTEMLLDDASRAHARARAAGVEAQFRVYPHAPHVFPLFGWLPEGRAALADIARFLRDRAAAPATGPSATMAAGAVSAPAILDDYARSGA
jgi:acetyl esterase/lipase